VPDSTPGAGGAALVADLKILADRIGPCKYDATAAPTADDDENDGYRVGSRWFNLTTQDEYICIDATATAAVWIATTLAPGSVGTSDLADLAVTTAKLAAGAVTVAKIAPFGEGETLLFGCGCCGIIHGCDDAGTPYLSIAHPTRLCLETGCIITAGSICAGPIVRGTCLVAAEAVVAGTCAHAKLVFASCCGIVGCSDFAALPAGCLCTTKAELDSTYYNAEMAFLKSEANCMYLMCVRACGGPAQLQVNWSDGVGLANLGKLIVGECLQGGCQVESPLLTVTCGNVDCNLVVGEAITAGLLSACAVVGGEQLLVPGNQCEVTRNMYWDGTDLMVYTGAAWVCFCQKS